MLRANVFVTGDIAGTLRIGRDAMLGGNFGWLGSQGPSIIIGGDVLGTLEVFESSSQTIFGVPVVATSNVFVLGSIGMNGTLKYPLEIVGQTIIDADFSDVGSSSLWLGDVTVGPNSTLLTPPPYYLNARAGNGPGSVAIAGFGLFGEECDPPDGSIVEVPAGSNGPRNVYLFYYGPLDEPISPVQFTVQRSISLMPGGGSFWYDVPGTINFVSSPGQYDPLMPYSLTGNDPRVIRCFRAGQNYFDPNYEYRIIPFQPVRDKFGFVVEPPTPDGSGFAVYSLSSLPFISGGTAPLTAEADHAIYSFFVHESVDRNYSGGPDVEDVQLQLYDPIDVNADGTVDLVDFADVVAAVAGND